MNIIIKKSKKNQYIRTSNKIWVRNFCLPCCPLHLSNLASKEDLRLFIDNESQNEKLNLPYVDSEQFILEKCIIVSDGYKFSEKQSLLKNIPVNILSVNKSLAKWNIEKGIFAYVVNNPFDECLNFLPRHKYYPRCICSARTSPEFVKRYLKMKGTVYKYIPTPEKDFSGYTQKSEYWVDDYRNPVCAAINLAYHFGAKKVLLFCCDDSFEDNRPASELLENGLYQYPQQNISNEIIDTMMYWARREVIFGNHSSGKYFNNAKYIAEDKLLEFFKDD